MSKDQPDGFTFSPIQTFFVKVAIVTGAILTILFSASSLTASFVTSQEKELKSLGGGSAFWTALEGKLYALADAPDVPAERKRKIIVALHRLSEKYRPYLDAFSDTRTAANDDAPTAERGPQQAQR